MRQHETLGDIMDAMRLYDTAIGTETINRRDPMGLYETAWDTDTVGDIVRQYETL